MNSYIAGNYKTLSNTISQVVPAVILENTNFEDLFLAYYKFTEQSGQFYKESKILFDSFNYSNADEKYLKIFKEQLLRMFPDNGQIALEYFLKCQAKPFLTKDLLMLTPFRRISSAIILPLRSNLPSPGKLTIFAKQRSEIISFALVP